MTNFEKWKDEIADISNANRRVAVVNGKPAICPTIDCKSCDFKGNVNCHYELLKWAASEYQEPAPKLTKREREFLECFTYPTHKKIYRKDYGLFIVAGDPGDGFSISNDMFPFINSGETWTFTDLLKLEVEE